MVFWSRLDTENIHEIVCDLTSERLCGFSRFFTLINLQIVGVTVASTERPDFVSETNWLSSNKHFCPMVFKIRKHRLVDRKIFMEDPEFDNGRIEQVIAKQHFSYFVSQSQILIICKMDVLLYEKKSFTTH